MIDSQLRQSITKLLQLAEFELASPAIPDPPPAFRRELEQAVRQTRQFLANQRPPAGEFFLSAAGRKRQRE